MPRTSFNLTVSAWVFCQNAFAFIVCTCKDVHSKKAFKRKMAFEKWELKRRAFVCYVALSGSMLIRRVMGD